MIKIYICEDDLHQQNILKDIVEKVIVIENLDMKISYVCESPYDLLKHVEMDDTGLFFLDIGLKSKMNGLVLAQKIRMLQPRCFIVFVTAYIEMSFLTFQYKVEALDYIIKDSRENMHKRIAECILKADQLYSTYDNKFQRIIAINIGDIKIIAQYDDILFFATSVNEHHLILYAKNRKVEFIGNLRELQQELNNDFYRCHRSYIVNKKNIDYVDVKKRIIHMISGDTCPISVRMLKGLK